MSGIAGTTPLFYRSCMNALFEAAKEVCDFMADQRWMDARGIAIRQGKTLDQSYLFKHLTELAALKVAPELVTQAHAILRVAT